jgi:hypothetical protein
MTADDYLRLAIHTGSPAAAGAYAMKGLRDAQSRIDPETTLLLLREIYRPTSTPAVCAARTRSRRRW